MVMSIRFTSGCAMIGLALSRAAPMARPLLAVARIGERLLGGALGDRDALQADGKPGLVHHGEHAGHAAVLLADEVTGGAAAVAEDHRAGRRAMNAELVLDRMRAHVVAPAGRAVRVEEEFGNQEQRDAPGPGRRVGEPGQHHVDDVVGQVVLAVGDENLLAGDAIAAVGGALGLGAQGADVGAGLRLGELHRARPLAGDELAQEVALERVGAVGGQRVGRAHGQHRADAESHGGGIPHLHAGGVQGVRQFLAAPLRGRGEAVPAGLGPGAIGFLPTGRRGDRAIFEGRPDAVADGIEGGQNLGGETAGFRQHRIDHVFAEIAVKGLGERRRKARRVLERKGDVGNRCPVRHCSSFR